MNGWTYACLAVGLLLLAGPVSALIPDTITIDTDGPPWLTAGSSETTIVTVQVLNHSTGITGFGGGAVEFAVDSAFGSIMPAATTTDATGMVTAVFKPGTRSGTVPIKVTVSYEGLDELLTGSVSQQIDHATANKIAYLWYDSEVTAGKTTVITVRMVDEYGNVVDNRNQTETVNLMVGSPTGGAVFVGGTDEILVSVDAAGNATATLQVDTVAGENMVLVTFPEDIGWRYLTINGLANGEPSEIYQTVSPKVEDPNPAYYPELPLGEPFTITYALYDEYGNVAGDHQIKVYVRPLSGSLPSSERVITTNSLGKAQLMYRSSDLTGVVEVTATAVGNSSVSCKQKVGFYSTTPTGMVLTAVPGTIASRDVKGDIVAHIKAKVMDSKGNPVRNESVSFRIIELDDGGYSMIDAPWISSGPLTSWEGGMPLIAITDDDGFATIDFHPGAFNRDTSDSLYSDMASGSATIEAVWNNEREDTTISFRNYPYLSVNVSVEPQVVALNSSVNVTIQLIGDGWALQSKPIDVVLCTDRSGSMLQNTTYGGGWSTKYPNWVEQESVDDRMVHAMRAAKDFTSQMQSSKDRIGLVSFGQDGTANLDTYDYKFWAGNDYTWGKRPFSLGNGWVYDGSDDNAYIAEYYKNPQIYYGPATRDIELTSTYGSVNTAIDNWLPCGGTPLREGLYQSVRMILDHPRTGNPVKAIVLMTDGAWNTGGNPEGGSGATSFPGVGTGSVIDYAKDNGIKIFTIALGNEPSHEELQRYANQTGGTFYSATAGDDLTRVYADIATKLQEAAGVDTMMELAFDNVRINSTPTGGVFRYEPVDPVSTRMIKYWTDNKTTIREPEWEDQSSDWNDETLTFDVGDIYLDQTWETTFRLKVLKEGNIDIFGDGSKIQFNGTQGETELGLPHTFITASLNLSETDIATADIWLDLLSVNTGDPGVLVPSWNLTYIGNESVVQAIMYQFSQDGIWWDGAWHVADTKHHPADMDVNGTYSSHLDLEGREGWYKIRVSAREDVPEGVSDEETYVDIAQVRMKNRTYIRIE